MNGKGDTPRPTDIRKYISNYEEIDWGHDFFMKKTTKKTNKAAKKVAKPVEEQEPKTVDEPKKTSSVTFNRW